MDKARIRSNNKCAYLYGWREKDAITNDTSEDIACLLITTLMPVADWNSDNEKSSQVKTG